VKRIRVVDARTTPFMRARDRGDRDRTRTDGPSQAEIDATEVRFHHPGTDTSPQLFEIRLAPDSEVLPHAHSEDEIIVIVEGELRVGSRVLGPGSSVAIDGDTLYGFRAGPNGVRFLNFRPRADAIYLNKTAYMARHRAGVKTDD
jgi:quercetin dioxygenase-like cupin family protein